MRQKVFPFLLLSLLLVMESGCSLLLQSDKPEQEQNNKTISATDVLEKSIQTMNQWKGFEVTDKWEQNLTLVNPNGQTSYGKNTLNNRLQFVDPNHFHVTIEIQSQLEQIRNNTALEIYVDGNMMYIKDLFINKWQQRIATESMKFQALGTNPEYLQPVYYLKKLKTHGSKLQMQKEGSAYVIQVTLSNHNEIKDLMQNVTYNAERDPSIDASRIQFHQLELKLWIDTKSFELKKVEQRAKLDVPAKNGVVNKIVQVIIKEINGEVTEIVVPQEAKNGNL